MRDILHCTFFTKEADPKRGHYIFASPFCKKITEQLDAEDVYASLVYGHVDGPRHFLLAPHLPSAPHFPSAPQLASAGSS